MRHVAIFLVPLLLGGCPSQSGAKRVVPVAQAPSPSADEEFRKLTDPEKAVAIRTTTEGRAKVDDGLAAQVVAVQSLHADANSLDQLVDLSRLPDGDVSSFKAANAIAGLVRHPEGVSRLLDLFGELPEKRREWTVALVGEDGTVAHLPLLGLAAADESPKVRARARRAEKSLLARIEGGAR